MRCERDENSLEIQIEGIRTEPRLTPDILKSAAAYLLQVARSLTGGWYRRSAKIDAMILIFCAFTQGDFSLQS